ncbi:MAG: flagellar filament capping protein FliD [Pseudomonadota bacterium]
MNITQIVNSSKANSLLNANTNASANTSAQATGSVSPVTQALQKADKRIQSQLDTTTAQLSSFGKLKSAVSDAQLSARALSNFSSTASSADVKSAANKFISAFNAAINTAKTTASVSGGVSAESAGARSVSSDLNRTVRASSATVDSLQQLGIKLSPDGSLTLDATKFDAAQKADPAKVKAALAKIGELVDKTATKELATGGGVSGSMASLNQRSTALKAQQTSLLAITQQAATAQSSSSSSSSSSNYARFGLAAYQSGY